MRKRREGERRETGWWREKGGRERERESIDGEDWMEREKVSGTFRLRQRGLCGNKRMKIVFKSETYDSVYNLRISYDVQCIYDCSHPAHSQESKLNLVEGLQKLLEVNGRKDVISRDYTTL